VSRSATIRGLAAALSFLAALIVSATIALGQDSTHATLFLDAALASGARKPTIVFVHDPFAGEISWQYVVPILKKHGYKVIHVENRLASLTDDIATTKKAIDGTKGRVVLVGHAFGGAVITGAAADPKVSALVYLAAFAPDANERVGAFNEKYPSAFGAVAVPNPAIFDQTIAFPAWRTIRSWYLVSRDHDAINPDLQRFFAKRMGATTCEVKGSRAASTPQAKTVARCIEEAATAGKTRND
jgi:pimeloyl-ACP methyl ester carboxylesterase